MKAEDKNSDENFQKNHHSQIWFYSCPLQEHIRAFRVDLYPNNQTESELCYQSINLRIDQFPLIQFQLLLKQILIIIQICSPPSKEYIRGLLC